MLLIPHRNQRKVKTFTYRLTLRQCEIKVDSGMSEIGVYVTDLTAAWVHLRCSYAQSSDCSNIHLSMLYVFYETATKQPYFGGNLPASLKRTSVLNLRMQI